MQVLEHDIERKSKLLAEKHGCLLLKIQGTTGYPDRLLILPNGGTAFVEFKRPMGIVSPIQTHYISKLEAMCQKVKVIRSVDQFQTYLSELLKVSEPKSGFHTDTSNEG